LSHLSSAQLVTSGPWTYASRGEDGVVLKSRRIRGNRRKWPVLYDGLPVRRFVGLSGDGLKVRRSALVSVSGRRGGEPGSTGVAVSKPGCRHENVNRGSTRICPSEGFETTSRSQSRKPNRASGDGNGWLETERSEGPKQEARRPGRVGKAWSRALFRACRRPGVRAFLVASKPGNSGGAKGRREMEAWGTTWTIAKRTNANRGRRQCRQRLRKTETPRPSEAYGTAGRGWNGRYGPHAC
jgi:hypothetical protein